MSAFGSKNQFLAQTLTNYCLDLLTDNLLKNTDRQSASGVSMVRLKNTAAVLVADSCKWSGLFVVAWQGPHLNRAGACMLSDSLEYSVLHPRLSKHTCCPSSASNPSPRSSTGDQSSSVWCPPGPSLGHISFTYLIPAYSRHWLATLTSPSGTDFSCSFAQKLGLGQDTDIFNILVKITHRSPMTFTVKQPGACPWNLITINVQSQICLKSVLSALKPTTSGSFSLATLDASLNTGF